MNIKYSDASPALFSRWTLRGRAEQRHLAPRQGHLKIVATQ